MAKNKIAALLLILFSVVFILLVLFVEKVSDTVLQVASFTVLATGGLFLYLYWQQFSKVKRRVLLLFFLLPALLLFLRSLA